MDSMQGIVWGKQSIAHCTTERCKVTFGPESGTLTPVCLPVIRTIVNRYASRERATVPSGFIGKDPLCCHSAGSLISDPADSLVAGSAYGDFGAGRTCTGKGMSRFAMLLPHRGIDLLAGCGYDAGGAPNSLEAVRVREGSAAASQPSI